MPNQARAGAAAPNAELMAFLREHGRLPRMGDAVAPWRYRGWLLPYVITLHGVIPAVAGRWAYHLRTLQAGRLLDAPIPQIAFGPPDNKVFALIQEWSRLVGHSWGGWDDFRALLDWLCWGLALGKEEPRLTPEVNEKLYRRVNLGPLLLHPYDYLGEHVSVHKARGWNPTGFYPTPHGVVECMVRMVLGDTRKNGRDLRTLKVCDPCVGSGRMLLHSSNITLRLYGMDIDPLAIAMCKVNGALYAPWLSFPLPDTILGADPDPPLALYPPTDPSPDDRPVFRVVDAGQGLLFDF